MAHRLLQDLFFQCVIIDLSHIADERILSACMLQQIIEILLVVCKVFCTVKQRLLPRIAVCSDPAHHLGNSLCMIPRDQIILVLELSVKGRGGIAAVLGDVPDGDPVDILFLCQLTEGFREDLFRCFSFHIITLRNIPR